MALFKFISKYTKKFVIWYTTKEIFRLEERDYNVKLIMLKYIPENDILKYNFVFYIILPLP